MVGVLVSFKKSYSFYKKLLYFYDTAGVDAALFEKPINNFVPIKKKKASQAVDNAEFMSTLSCQRQSRMQISSSAQLANALKEARNAQTLEELKIKLETFNGCHLKSTAKNTCFSDGTPGSMLMLIGEAPGRDEDIQGLPFVGRSGQLLNQMLAAIGLKRDQVYIANTIPWRPPGNRMPTFMEVEICHPFIDRQIELADPKVLVALGGIAAKSLIGSKEGILRLRGNWYVYRTSGGAEIPIMPTLHPAYLLRTPSQKKFAWNDLLKIKMHLKEISKLE